jgi:hypothetical protein
MLLGLFVTNCFEIVREIELGKKCERFFEGNEFGEIGGNL